MKQPMEIKIQEDVILKLSSYDIYPFSVIFTYSGGISDGLLSITFFSNSDIDNLLKILNYENQCDKAGYYIIKDYNTLILSGIALINFYTV